VGALTHGSNASSDSADEDPSARAGDPALACAGEGPDQIPGRLRALCRLEALPDGTSKAFPPAAGGFAGLFAVRQGDAVHVYVNSCPHLGVPLDWMPDRFLSADGSRIICATHGAEFRIADGVCLQGPCRGDVLEPVSIQIKGGTVFVSETAGY
jgi:nitrite reductase/ring-hydroxylating ferredoxin subunit